MKNLWTLLFILFCTSCTQLEEKMIAAKQSTSQIICFNVVINAITNETDRYCLKYMGRVE